MTSKGQEAKTGCKPRKQRNLAQFDERTERRIKQLKFDKEHDVPFKNCTFHCF